MIDHDEIRYDTARETEERAAAVVATSSSARRIHLELARRYAERALVSEETGVSSEPY